LKFFKDLICFNVGFAMFSPFPLSRVKQAIKI